MKVIHDEGRFVTIRAATRMYSGNYHWHDRVFLKNSQPSTDKLEHDFSRDFQFLFNNWGIS